MSKDVKIETIYYKSDTDVSLEFGLHGNYPVRLLSSSSNSLTTFFHALKRAVSRSQIIIIVGGYKGDEFIPSFVARTINRKCVVPEYNKAGVICKEKYPLPEGAIPLAPSNKRFGGFLIESGPQTIISLTENKKIRLDIVNDVIVKYIEEHHNYFLNEPILKREDDEIALSVLPEINKSEEAPSPIPTAFEDIESSSDLSEFADLSVSNAVNGVEETNIETEEIVASTDDTEALEAENSSEQSVTVAVPEEESSDGIIDIVSHKYIDPESNILTDITPDDFNFDETEQKNKRNRPKRRFIRLLCIILSLLIIIATAIGVFINGKNTASTTHTRDYYSLLAEKYESYGNDYQAAFKALKEYNEQINAWINFENSTLNYPIISVESNDSFYYNHLPDGTENIIGSVYSSSEISSAALKNNVIIYGSAKSGLGVFSELIKLFDEIDITKIEKITLANEYGKSDWRIFSVFTDDESNGFIYDVDSFENETKFIAFSNQVARHTRTQYMGILSDYFAPILTLIAIDDSKRYIVCATPFDNVAFIDNPNYSPTTPENDNTSSETLVDINDATIDFEGKTEENTDKFEQTPIKPDSVITLPQITVKPPINNTSSQSPTSSKEPSSSANSSVTGSQSSSDTPNDITSSDTVSNDKSDISSDESSSPSSSEPSLDTSVESSSEPSSESSADSSNEPSTDSSGNVSSEPSSEIENSSDNSSSESSSSNTDTPAPPAEIDPLYTWDITLYVKNNGTTVYGTASEIVARVIEAEMGASFPHEALKAQAVATYAWLLNNGAMDKNKAPKNVPMKKEPSAKVLQAVAEAKGTLITYNGAIAQTYYYAYSAGYTANVQDIWNDTIPYLQSVECQVDTELSNFITTKTYTADKIKELILNKCGIDVSEMEKTEWIKPIEYDGNNTYCKYVEIGSVKYKGLFLRSTLLENGIRSTAFTVEYNSETDSFTFTCKGWGHGVGMSQMGAKAYANQGWTSEQILTHFYPGVTLMKF